MHLELTAGEARLLRSALHTYLTDLRGEIANTDKHEWRVALHHEESTLAKILSQLESTPLHAAEP